MRKRLVIIATVLFLLWVIMWRSWERIGHSPGEPMAHAKFPGSLFDSRDSVANKAEHARIAGTPGRRQLPRQPVLAKESRVDGGQPVSGKHQRLAVEWKAGSTTRAEDYDTSDILHRLMGDPKSVYHPGHSVIDYSKLAPMASPGAQPADDGSIRVVIIPHSHNDPGWLETFEHYYEESTRQILDNVVDGLRRYPDWRFIWSEMSFLHRWWGEQSERRREQVRKLVRSGRLELTTGGWVMPDEANTHYYAVLEQLIEGHQWIRANVDAAWQPRSSWSNDPFGYSSSVAHLYQQAGVPRLMILRTHYALKRHLAQRRALQFNWRQPWDAARRAAVFAHLEPSALYSTKHSCGPSEEACCAFDFFYLHFCQDGGECDCKVQKITAANIRRKAQLLLEQARAKAKLFRSNTVAVLNGDDFRYTSVQEVTDQYENFKLLMDYINDRPELKANVRFGTLHDFLEEAQQAPSVKFPYLHGDFFPYSDDRDAYWTGYFSSRPYHKRLGRAVQSLLYATDLLYVLAGGRVTGLQAHAPRLSAARHEFNVFQHHDAVTGTSRTYVMADYERRLQGAYGNLSRTAAGILGKAAGLASLRKLVTARFMADGARTSVLDGGKARTLLVFNPLPRSRTQIVSVLTATPLLSVLSCTSNTAVPTQVQLLMDNITAAGSTPRHARKRSENAGVESYRVTFEATLPALGYSLYTLAPARQADASTGWPSQDVITFKQKTPHGLPKLPSFWPGRLSSSTATPFVVATDSFSASFSADGLLTSVSVGGNTVPVGIAFVRYQEQAGGEQTGGAYIFQPRQAADRPAQPATYVRRESGVLCHYVTSAWAYVRHTVRLCNASRGGVRLSITNHVSVAEMNENDVDLAMRVTSSLASGDVFFTDLNSLQVAQRRRFADRLAPNFYPCTSLAYIEDRHWRLSLHTRQPLGVASLKAGSLEVVLDRLTNLDDGRGPVGGTPDYRPNTLSEFELVLEAKTSAAPAFSADVSLDSQLTSERLLHPPLIFSSPSSRPHDAQCQSGFLHGSLPCDVQVVAVRPVQASGAKAGGAHASATATAAALVLHRLPVSRTTFVPGPNPASECPKSGGALTIASLFPGKRVKRAQYSSLSLLNQHGDVSPDDRVSLEPMQLQSFLIEFSRAG